MTISSPKRRTAGHRDLDVWQVGMELVVAAYSATKTFPSDERFGLTAQIRRAVVSIPANLAEGHARRGSGEFRHFVSIARGSLAELDTELEAAERLGFVPALSLAETRRLMTSVGRMLTALAKALRE